jgi:ribosomal protein L22
MGKTQYSRNPTGTKVARASGKDIRVHYKNTYETAKAIKGLTIANAKEIS